MMSSIDSLYDSSGDDTVVELCDMPFRCSHADNEIQQAVLLSVSRADDIQTLNNMSFSESGKEDDEKLILSDNAYSKQLWKKVLSGPIFVEEEENFGEVVCPILLDCVIEPIRLQNNILLSHA